MSLDEQTSSWVNQVMLYIDITIFGCLAFEHTRILLHWPRRHLFGQRLIVRVHLRMCRPGTAQLELQYDYTYVA